MCTFLGGSVSAEIFFYNTPLPLTRIIPILVEKVYSQNKRCVLLTANADECARWNAQLWTYSTLSFLPHASDTQNLPASAAEAQPIFITAEATAPNSPVVAFNLRGALATGSFERVIEFISLLAGTPDAALGISESLTCAQKRLSSYSPQHTGTLWNQQVSGEWQSVALSPQAQAA